MIRTFFGKNNGEGNGKEQINEGNSKEEINEEDGGDE